jgi:hypothetical protein
MRGCRTKMNETETGLAVLVAKFDDFKNEYFADMKEIKADLKETRAQTTATNGKVAKTMIDIANCQKAEEMCSARRWYEKGRHEEKEWTLKKVGLIITVANIVIMITFQLLFKQFGG